MTLLDYVFMGIILAFYIGGGIIGFIEHIMCIRKCMYCKTNLHTECEHTFCDIILNPQGKNDIPVFYCGERITHCRLYRLTVEEREKIKRRIEELD